MWFRFTIYKNAVLFFCTLTLSAAATVANIKIRYVAKTPQFAIFGTRVICVFYSILVSIIASLLRYTNLSGHLHPCCKWVKEMWWWTQVFLLIPCCHGVTRQPLPCGDCCTLDEDLLTLLLIPFPPPSSGRPPLSRAIHSWEGRFQSR